MLRVDVVRREITASVRDLAFPPGALPRAAGGLGVLRAELGSDVHRRYRLSRERSVAGFRGEVALALDRVVDGFSVRLHAKERAAVAGRLRFPYDGHRLHQDELVAGIRRALAQGRPILAEAPTGIGKTVAALLPALERALERDAVVFYLTSKRTQRLHVGRTFEDIASASDLQPGQLRAITLRPQHDMCPPRTLNCHVDHCPLLANLHDRTRRERAVDALLAGAAHISPEATLACGEREQVCPHVLAQVLCAHVDLVIGDYNHVYGSAAEPGLFPGAVVARSVLVVADEVHNLLDRAREYDSVFLSRRTVAALAGRTAPASKRETTLFGVVEPGAERCTDLRRALAGLFVDVLEVIDRTIATVAREAARSRDGCRATGLEAADWDSLALRGARLMVRYLQTGAAQSGVLREDPIVQALDALLRLRALTHRDDPAFVGYVACDSVGRRGRGVGVCCVDPARRLAQRHRQMLGTVAMSATLAPLSHYRVGLGFGDLDPVELSLPSPFPPEHRHVVVVPTVGTSWSERRRSLGAIADTIQRVVAVRPGHYAAFFPSFRFLDDVRDRLDVDAKRLLVQRPRMSDDDRGAVLDRLRVDTVPLLLLAVAGGVFAEGIDLPGDALIGAIVVGPALPAIGFERDAMRHYHEERGDDGFARALLYPGMQRVIQAAGRVHRTAADRGVIVLLDHRFSRSPYADCLPADWRPNGVRGLVECNPAAALERFWRDGPAVPPRHRRMMVPHPAPRRGAEPGSALGRRDPSRWATAPGARGEDSK